MILGHLLEGREAEAFALRAQLASKPKGDRGLVARMEAAIVAAPASAITLDPKGSATVDAAGHRFDAGRFAVRSIGELREQANRGSDSHRVRLSVLRGAVPITDIGLLQATAEPGTVFQVASQFNCLEAPGPGLVQVAAYFGDSTQGPRASISAFPGTFLRHYAAPADDGTRFVQSDERQLNLLAAALPERIARVRSGYLMTQEISNLDLAAESLQERFDQLRVGVHDGIEVVLGANWDGAVLNEPRIAQVFTSTLAAGGYSRAARIAGATEEVCRQLLRAAYLGTLLAASTLGMRRVVLTMIGGGVFGNPHLLIWESILWAVEQTEPLLAAPLDVVLNGRELNLDPGAILKATAARGGVFIEAQGGHVARPT